jgi:hypothetical protein
MNGRGGVHWYGRNGWPGANNPDESQLPPLARRASTLRRRSWPRRGVDVVNASPISDLKASAEWAALRPPPRMGPGLKRSIYIGWDPREIRRLRPWLSRRSLSHLSKQSLSMAWCWPT